MGKKLAALLLFSFTFCLSGCFHVATTVTGIVEEKTASDTSKADRWRRVKGPGPATFSGLRVPGGIKASVGDFTSFDPGRKTYACRVISALISPPSDMTYEQYFRSELEKQLKVDRFFDAQSGVVLTGKIESMENSPGDNYWVIVLKVSSSNGRSVTVSNKYEYRSSFWGGDNACSVAKAEMPFAVRYTIIKAVEDPAFPSLFGG